MDLVACGDQRRQCLAPDQTGGAGDQNSHGNTRASGTGTTKQPPQSRT